jgi:hypothetical protein
VTKTLVWSYGGGVQTAAIAVLIRNGGLPRPDIAIMADTGREATATWDYLHNVLQPYLDPVGVKVQIASHSLATTDLYAHNGDLLIPAFTSDGKLPTFCSGEWKRDVVRRQLRLFGVTECDLWLGISFDERERAKPSTRKWVNHVFPLVDNFISREGCLMLVEKAGLPRPPKSSCWMCPHRKNEQWRDLRDNHPEDWRKAIAVDEQIRAADQAQGNSGVYLHTSRVPLAMADIEEPTSGQLDLFGVGCSSGYCWT